MEWSWRIGNLRHERSRESEPEEGKAESSTGEPRRKSTAGSEESGEECTHSEEEA